jgi:sugar-specific transcriptional regulator TrmB
MSWERVLKILESFGLSRTESEVYVYLAKTGPSKVIDLTISLRISKQKVYSILRKLKAKEIVTVRPERNTVYSALTFNELLNRYIKKNNDQAEFIRETTIELINNWQKMEQ